MDAKDWEKCLKALEVRIPPKDMGLAQSILMEVSKTTPNFGLDIKSADDWNYYELWLAFQKYVCIKRIAMYVHTVPKAQARAEIDKTNPLIVNIVIKIIKDGHECAIDKTAPVLSVPVDPGLTAALTIPDEDKDKIETIAHHAVNLDQSQKRVNVHFYDNDADGSYTVACNNVHSIDLNNCYWMMCSIGPETVRNVHLVCQMPDQRKPCSLDVTFAQSEGSDDEEEEERPKRRDFPSAATIPAKRRSAARKKSWMQSIASMFFKQ